MVVVKCSLKIEKEIEADNKRIKKED